VGEIVMAQMYARSDDPPMKRARLAICAASFFNIPVVLFADARAGRRHADDPQDPRLRVVLFMSAAERADGGRRAQPHNYFTHCDLHLPNNTL
jgi:hypothetical protein